MTEDILNNDEFWKELGLDVSELEQEQPKAEPAKETLTEAPKPKKKKKKKTSDPQEQKKPGKKKKSSKKTAKKPTVVGTVTGTFLKTVVVVMCLVVTLMLLGGIVMMGDSGSAATGGAAAGVTILDKFDMFLTNQVSNALDGVLSIKKVYWLSDSDLVAPKPKAENFGTVASPAELMPILENAKGIIGDHKLVFNEQTPIWEKEGVHYYYDDTILVITWKQVIDRVMYTMSEVRIAHPSQFRRFLAGGEFGSDKLYVTTDMAKSVNSVVACSGDYYRFRRFGAVVYEGQLRRFEGEKVDTCFINEDGDLLFAYRGDLKSEAEAKKFIEDNRVRFSMAFGPILVDGGKPVTPPSYPLGETNDTYSRAGLAQVDDLHYLLISAGGEGGYENRHTIAKFAEAVASFGVEKAYALDGGQTTVIAMNGELINNVDFGYQRQISDIIYFATAIPEGE